MRSVSPLRQRLPLAGVLLAAMMGILLASFLGKAWSLAAALGVAGMLALPFRARGGGVWFLTAVVFAQLQLWSWNEAPARKLAAWLEEHPGEFSVRGVVAAEPKSTPSGSVTFPLRLEHLAPVEEAGSPVTLPVPVLVRWEGPAPAYGDAVEFHGIPRRPPLPRNPGAMDYRGWLERHGIHTEFRIDPSSPGRILSRGHGNPLMAWAITARHRMERLLETDLAGSPEVVGAIKGICLGVTENAPEGFTDDFRFTGTMHLFSVSGLHVGMLAVIIWFALRALRVPRPWAVAATIPALFFYVAVTGLKSGSIRSATMASILLVGTVLFRRSPLVNTLAASALLQLAVDTNTLFSAGWQFSYAVVLAILLAAPPLEGWLRGFHAPDPFLPPVLLTRRERLGFSCWNHVAGLAAVSAAAWIGSLLPTLAYFHLVSLSALGANLLAVPLAFAVLALGALALLTGSFSLWCAGAFNNANWLVTKVLLLVVQASALIPGGHWFVGSPGRPYPVMTLLDLRGASCAVIRSGGETALVDAGHRRDADAVILPFLEESGGNSLRSVLVTKSDAVHLGGLARIEREVRVRSLALPPGPGRSPTARKLEPHCRNVTRLQAGEESVLAPGVTATVLACLPGKDPDSVITRVNLGTLRVLLLPRLAEGVAARVALIPEEELRSAIVVLPLGGSDMVSTLQVIRRVAPRVVVSSVEGLSRNGIPNAEWRRLLGEEGITLLRQDETGAVVMVADPKGPRAIPWLQPEQPVPLDVGSPVTRANPKTPLPE